MIQHITSLRSLYLRVACLGEGTGLFRFIILSPEEEHPEELLRLIVTTVTAGGFLELEVFFLQPAAAASVWHQSHSCISSAANSPYKLLQYLRTRGVTNYY
jgi:hypothetical protein